MRVIDYVALTIILSAVGVFESASHAVTIPKGKPVMDMVKTIPQGAEITYTPVNGLPQTVTIPPGSYHIKIDKLN